MQFLAPMMRAHAAELAFMRATTLYAPPCNTSTSVLLHHGLQACSSEQAQPVNQCTAVYCHCARPLSMLASVGCGDIMQGGILAGKPCFTSLSVHRPRQQCHGSWLCTCAPPKLGLHAQKSWDHHGFKFHQHWPARGPPIPWHGPCICTRHIHGTASGPPDIRDHRCASECRVGRTCMQVARPGPGAVWHAMRCICGPQLTLTHPSTSTCTPYCTSAGLLLCVLALCHIACVACMRQMMHAPYLTAPTLIGTWCVLWIGRSLHLAHGHHQPPAPCRHPRGSLRHSCAGRPTPGSWRSHQPG